MNAHASGTAIHTILNEEQAAAAEAGKETMEFQADVNRVMGLIINSLYSNKEIFLRELISNSADALSKVRVLSLTDPEYMGEHTELDIHIKADPEANTLTISDSGVGMTKEDLIGKLGSIASSGTKQFSEALAGKDSDLIGQFGVGFYAAYLLCPRTTTATSTSGSRTPPTSTRSPRTRAGTPSAAVPRSSSRSRRTHSSFWTSKACTSWPKSTLSLSTTPSTSGRPLRRSTRSRSRTTRLTRPTLRTATLWRERTTKSPSLAPRPSPRPAPCGTGSSSTPPSPSGSGPRTRSPSRSTTTFTRRSLATPRTPCRTST